jgi:ribosomal protein L40E
MAGNIGLAMAQASMLVMALLIACYPIWRIVALWFDRALPTGEAVISLSVLVFLILGIIATAGTPISFVLLLALIVICCGVPLLNRLADHMALRRMADQDLRDYRLTVTRQPGNAYARERLARIYLDRKQYEEALEHVNAVLERDAKDPKFIGLKDRVETEKRRHLTRAKVCPKCTAENPPEAGACMECGFRFVDPGDFLRLLLSESGQQATRLAGIVFGALGIVLLLVGVAVVAAGLVFLFGIGCLMIFLYGRLRERF